MIALIAAQAENRVIGHNNELPWRIKSEFAYFARMTKGKPLVMGRKTFDSLGAPLKDRPNIVITRDKSYKRDGITVVSSLEEGIAVAKQYGDEIMIGGGAEIYKQALPLADRLYLTVVHLNPEGDAHFPAFDHNAWKKTKSEFHAALPGESADYTIEVWDKV